MSFDHEVVVEERGWRRAIGEDPAYFRGGEEDRLRSYLRHPTLHRLLAREIYGRAVDCDNFARLRCQAANECGSHHAAVPCHPHTLGGEVVARVEPGWPSFTHSMSVLRIGDRLIRLRYRCAKVAHGGAPSRFRPFPPRAAGN